MGIAPSSWNGASFSSQTSANTRKAGVHDQDRRDGKAAKLLKHLNVQALRFAWNEQKQVFRQRNRDLASCWRFASGSRPGMALQCRYSWVRCAAPLFARVHTARL